MTTRVVEDWQAITLFLCVSAVTQNRKDFEHVRG
jgi:hypothetical protein